MIPRSWRAAFWVAQLLIAGTLVWFVWKRLARDWAGFTHLELDVRPGPVVASFAVVLTTYGLLIWSWRAVVRGWNQPLGIRAAATIWMLSNLGRYLPLKVWSLAGMAVLSQRAGISGWSTTGSAVIMQAISLGTGAMLVTALAPGIESPARLLGAALVAAATIAIPANSRAMAAVSRMLKREVPVASPGALVTAAIATSIAWLGYGLALHLLARGILGSVWPGPLEATGLFALGYIVGLISIVPGGVGVREVVLAGLLAPGLGQAAAVALSVASRLALTAAEIAGAAGALPLLARLKETRD